MSVTTPSHAAAAADPQGPPGGVRGRPASADDSHRVIDFASAEVEMNSSCRLALEARRWLDWQCRMVSGVGRGAVFLAPKVPGGALERAALWPDGESRSIHLRNVAARAIASADGLTQKEIADDGSGAEVCDYVAYPLVQNGRVVGAVALALAIRSEAQHQAVLQLLQWGAVWLEDAIGRGGDEGLAPTTLALDAVQQLSEEVPLPVAAHQLCNHLADTLDCSLVALGQVRGLQLRLLAMSHQLKFDHRMRRVAQIEFAMEECVDRAGRVTLPAHSDDEGGISQASAQLLSETGGAVCSVPVLVGGEAVAALTLLRDRDRPFDQSSLDLIEAVVGQIGPLLRLRQRQAQSLLGGLRQTLARPLGRLFGRGHLRIKSVVLGLLALLAVLTMVQTDHRISARSTVEGAMQQALVAPFAGYLIDAQARAGDRVEQGQVLAALDERELLLEQERLSGERDKHRKEYQEALAKRDRAGVTMVSARIDQVDAQLRLVKEQLERTRLVAPFAGLLVSGDWSRALGAPVERGQLLFEIVPDQNYRIMLQVDEHDMSHIATGQAGALRLTGMPDKPIDFEVARILPVAMAADGGNHFRVEATLPQLPMGLRPGMQGIAKVTVGRGSLLDVWTASLRSRLQLWAWSLGL
jgi:multidrug resistance efflux pump